ncbi:MAG TPA: methyltransferase domain-containing protein [Candidatus Limnocylindrales bacterium]|nr:methyltransferase domain-containing protein [Candidatus Limnocylindrales bacterium]
MRRVEVSGDTYFYYRGVSYPEHLNRGNACSHIAARALTYCRGRGIDVGASDWPLPGSIPVRDEPHQNAYKLDDFPDASLDFVFSSHCLEHLEHWQKALRLWIRKIKPGGILFLYLPHESMKLWRKCGPWVGLGHQWIPTSGTILSFLEQNNLGIVDYNPGRDDYWSFHLCARRPGG